MHTVESGEGAAGPRHGVAHRGALAIFVRENGF